MALKVFWIMLLIHCWDHLATDNLQLMVYHTSVHETAQKVKSRLPSRTQISCAVLK